MAEVSTQIDGRATELADGVFWVGFADLKSGLHCNPYLVIERGEAVIIDGGSRPDFPSVMIKILSTGISPSSIVALIYHHYDPDLCGSIPHFEDIIGRADLRIFASRCDHMFIRHYSARSSLVAIEEADFQFRFSSGRTLRFIPTPYAHNAGSYVTFDPRSGILFSSDLFGSYGLNWELFLQLRPECVECEGHDPCPMGGSQCPIPGIVSFHEKIFPSVRALRHALERIAGVPFRAIAPQHGSIIQGEREIEMVWRRVASLTAVGIDKLVGDRMEFCCDRSPVGAGDF